MYLYTIDNQLFINYFRLKYYFCCLFICVLQNKYISLHRQVKTSTT